LRTGARTEAVVADPGSLPTWLKPRVLLVVVLAEHLVVPVGHGVFFVVVEGGGLVAAHDVARPLRHLLKVVLRATVCVSLPVENVQIDVLDLLMRKALAK